jgi:cytochrome c oxidase subunit 2
MNGHGPGDRRTDGRSLMSRRGFVAAASFGAVSLYGLWVGLGAAPLRIWELETSTSGEMDMAGGHEGHGGGTGPDPEEFRREAAEYNANFTQPDGSVEIFPPRGDQTSAPIGQQEAHDGAQSMTEMDMQDGSHASHSMVMPAKGTDAHKSSSAPTDVYLLAQKWSFEPAVLRLAVNQVYRLRMMAVDAAHGASIQLGSAAHIIRLPRGALVEREFTFTRPGEYLLYCTMYCGEGHQYMSGKIIIV